MTYDLEKIIDYLNDDDLKAIYFFWSTNFKRNFWELG